LGIFMVPLFYVLLQGMAERFGRPRKSEPPSGHEEGETA